MEKIIRWLIRSLGRVDPKLILAACVITILLLGIFDFVSGFELSFSLFYLLPVSITAWFINRNQAFSLSVLSAMVWAISNQLAGESYSLPWIGYWNTLIRLSFFIIVSLLITLLKEVIEKERDLSRTDFLTGITNSRAFYELASREILRSRRYQRPLSLAYIDLDNFKQINDRFGHKIGDDLLKIVAETMINHLRSTDIVARMGGDEFVVLLPETDADAAQKVIKKLSTFLSGTMENHHWGVTFSIGTITFYTMPASLDELIRKADELMYTVKQNGKNNIAFIRSDEPHINPD